MINKIALLLCLCLGVVSMSFGDVPHEITYQGRLTDDAGVPLTGTYDLIFKIYETSDASADLWQEAHGMIPVENGLFTVDLGSFIPIPDSVFNGTSRYLGIAISGEDEFLPRTQIISVPYAYRSIQSDTAAYAHAGPGGSADGWVDDGSVVRLFSSGDKVGIGTSTPSEPLVVGKDLGEANGDYIVIGNDTPDRWSGIKLGEDENNHAQIIWGNNNNELTILTRESGIFQDGMTMTSGKVGIGVPTPGEPLVVGRDLGSYNGNRIVVGDNTAGSYTGFMAGEDSNNRGWLLWDVDGNFLDMGLKNEGTQYNNVLTLKDGKVGIGTSSPAGKLHVTGSGNDAVQLPTDAVSSTEMMNEPGLGVTIRSSPYILYEGNDYVPIMGRSMDFPSSGYAVVIVSFEWDPTTGPDQTVIGYYSLSESPAAAGNFTYEYHIYSSFGTDDGYSFHTTINIPSAGSKSIYFVGKFWSGDVTQSEVVGEMVVMFFPTSYASKSGDYSDDENNGESFFSEMAREGEAKTEPTKLGPAAPADIVTLEAQFEQKLQALREEFQQELTALQQKQ